MLQTRLEAGHIGTGSSGPTPTQLPPSPLLRVVKLDISDVKYHVDAVSIVQSILITASVDGGL